MRHLLLVPVLPLLFGLLGCHLILGEESSERDHVTGRTYTDVTKESGAKFRFEGDFFDGKLIPTMGGGVALADIDGDGWLDILFVQQVKNASRWRKSGGTQPLENCTRIFRNEGNGTFEDFTERSGIRACGWGVTAMFADLDNDGAPDLVIGNAGHANSVWHNDGHGRFTLVPASGLETGCFTVGLAALDFDGDGIPDVYVGCYLDTDPARESKMRAGAFMTPDEYAGHDNHLMKGKGDMSFLDVTEESGTRDPGSKTIGAVAFDYDDDGRTDLYISNDQWRNTLFHNEGDGRFRDVSDETGTGYPQEGPTAFGRRTRSGMGLIATDLDGDGRPELYVTNYSGEPDTLYRDVEGTLFEQSERAAFGGDRDPTLPLSKWGAVAVDYDNDGQDDIAVSPGQILSRFWTVVAGMFNPQARNFGLGERSYAQRQLLFHNESEPGALRFRDVSAEAGDLGRLVIVGRGLSAGDLDGDGRQDLVFNPISHPAIVLRNTFPAAGKAIEILPMAGEDRKTVLGAAVRVDGHRKDFYVVPSYASGSWVPLHVGIGQKESGHVSVRWPDGTAEDLGDLTAGAYRLQKGKKPEPLRRRP